MSQPRQYNNLDGREVLEAILADARRKLEEYGFGAQHLTYPRVSWSIEIEILAYPDKRDVVTAVGEIEAMKIEQRLVKLSLELQDAKVELDRAQRELMTEQNRRADAENAFANLLDERDRLQQEIEDIKREGPVTRVTKLGPLSGADQVHSPTTGPVTLPGAPAVLFKGRIERSEVLQPDRIRESSADEPVVSSLPDLGAGIHVEGASRAGHGATVGGGGMAPAGLRRRG